jgi:hypothetical protein
MVVRPAAAVIANLEHRHSYVRKNAVLALAAIFRLPKGELLAPDAPELVERMLQNEQVCGCLWGASRVVAEHRSLEQQPTLWGRRKGLFVDIVHPSQGFIEPPASSLPHLPGTRCCLLVLQDLSTRRNAFVMLADHAQDKAVAYLFQQIDRVADWGDILQIAVLDLIRKVGSREESMRVCGRRAVAGGGIADAGGALFG